MEWTRLSIECPRAAEEAVAAIMSDLAPGGVAVEDTATGSRVSIYVMSGSQAAETYAQLQSRLIAVPRYLTGGALKVERQMVAEDWAEAWKKHYRPFRIGRRLVVKPSWEQWPPADDPDAGRPDDVVIEIDPGQAFGTGQHQTTRLCLRVLEDLVCDGTKVLDVGCGCGILSIAAARLGAETVIGVDTDEVAAQTARDNARRSGVGQRIRIHHGNIDVAGDDYYIIVANITAPVVKGIAATSHRKIQPGGYFVSSGYTHRFADDVKEALSQTGFHVVDIRHEDEWQCLVARKPD